jgi:hypothetical protein
MYRRETPMYKKTFAFCDSPSLDDTAGVEVDIANGVGMIDTLHYAKTMRVIVILSYDAFIQDRMAGVIKIGETLCNIFYEPTVMESIAFYFNKVPVDKIAELPHCIEAKI